MIYNVTIIYPTYYSTMLRYVLNLIKTTNLFSMTYVIVSLINYFTLRISLSNE